MGPLPSYLPRDNSIGFLRLVLAALVVYSHAHLLGGFGAEALWPASRETLIAGSLAVQAFFVLSGRLIAESWCRHPHLGRFLRHRVLRIAPALWVCLLVTAFGLTPLLHLTTTAPEVSWAELTRRAIGYVVRNLVLPRSQIAISPHPEGVPWSGDWNGSLWTLFYEGAAYLMIAVLGVATLLRRWRILTMIAVLGVLVLGTVWQVSPSWLPHPLPRLLDAPGKQLTLFFFAGSIWTLLPVLDRALQSPWVGPLLTLGLLSAIFSGWYGIAGPWLLPGVLFWVARVLPVRNFEQRVGGDYSYGLYLYGYPVHQTLAHFGAHHLGFWPWFLLGLVLAMGLAVLSWRWVESPALTWKNSRSHLSKLQPE